MNTKLKSCKTPPETVALLDKYIISQDKAKKAVAIAIRNRYRRQQLSLDLQEEIYPKNILMIGPTGVGKTEIARRLAKLTGAPFIKVEATKFTEVGYHGRDVDTVIRDLTDYAYKMVREEKLDSVKVDAEQKAIEKIVDLLVPKTKSNDNAPDEAAKTRALFKEKLLSGKLDDHEIEIKVANSSLGVEIMAPPGMEDMIGQLQSLFQSIGSDKKKLTKMKIKDAIKVLSEESAAQVINEEDIKAEAINLVEQSGIVFIDEFDKISQRSNNHNADISREGVQRDLLPLVEGCTISTKYGSVKTDHILFIASGAFHLTKPSDLIPELQGRFPIRVELNSLQIEDFVKILKQVDASLTIQYSSLLGVEGIELEYDDSGINKIAEIAWRINEKSENIGARRLYTVMERVLEEISFAAHEYSGQKIVVDAKFVTDNIADIIEDEDLSKFIL